MNKENMGERPSRSILKNDTMLPLLPSTNRLNRRVSFHPEVTLHKINFVPVQVDKRRETIAIIPLLRDNSDSGNSSIESRDDSNSINFDEIGAPRENADQSIESNIELGNNNDVGGDSDEDLANFDGNTDEGEEETMELTGQFVPNAEDVPSDTRYEEKRAILANNEIKNTVSIFHPADDDVVGSPPCYLEEEGDMELTSNVGLSHQSVVNMVGTKEGSENLNDQESDQGVEDHAIPNYIPEINNSEYSIQLNDGQDQQIQEQSENENELEETMDITKFYSQVNIQTSNSHVNENFNQEITMDITKMYRQEDRLEFINDIPDAEPIMQYNESLKYPENESIMEFTQEIGKINISDKGPGNQLGRILFQKTENQTNSNSEKVEEDQEDNKTGNEAPLELDSKNELSESISDEIHTHNPDEAFATQKYELNKENEKMDKGSDNQDNELNETPKKGQENDLPNHNLMSISMKDTIENAEKDIQDYTYMELTQIEQAAEPQESPKTYAKHEADQLSQNMQLTQEHGKIKEVQLKRTIEDTELKTQKYPKIDNHSGINKTTTTTIPLADISTESIDDHEELDQNYIPVSLNEFLKDISIRFYDDLEIGIKSVDRISISLPKINDEKSYKFDEFVTAMNKIPLLELYDFSCKELTKNIKDGTKLFDQFNQFTMENNPRLFKQYYLSSPNEKLGMKSEFQLIKDYTRHQAKEVWYGWRTQLIKNLIIQLDEKHDILLQDRLVLLKNLALINEIHEQLKIKFINLSNQLNQLLQIESQCKDLDSSNLFSLRNELATICKEFEESRKNQTIQNQELNKLNSIISDNKSLINAFTDEIYEVEKSLNSNRKYELSEIELLKLKFNFLQSFTNLNYKYMEGTKLMFNFIGVEVEMNFKDISDPSNISYSVTQNSSTTFHNTFLTTYIAPKLFNFISGSTIIESFQIFKKYWSLLKSIDEDIYAISWKLPVAFIESQDDAIDFKIRYYCGKLNFKVELLVSIDLCKLLDYPNNLQIKGKLIRSDIRLSQQIIRTNLLNDCVHNALVNEDRQIIIDGL